MIVLLSLWQWFIHDAPADLDTLRCAANWFYAHGDYAKALDHFLQAASKLLLLMSNFVKWDSYLISIKLNENNLAFS